MKKNVIILASKGVLKWSTNINLSKSGIVMFKGAKQLVVNHFIPLKPSLAVLIWTSNHKPDIKALLTWLFVVCSLSEMPKSLNLKVANKYHECIAGGSLRFWTVGQLSLTTGQRIGKALRALPSSGGPGACSPGKFWNSIVARMCFPAFWSCRQWLSSERLNHKDVYSPRGIFSTGAGCIENHFYSLPFGQAEASIY